MGSRARHVACFCLGCWTHAWRLVVVCAAMAMDEEAGAGDEDGEDIGDDSGSDDDEGDGDGAMLNGAVPAADASVAVQAPADAQSAAGALNSLVSSCGTCRARHASTLSRWVTTAVTVAPADRQVHGGGGARAAATRASRGRSCGWSTCRRTLAWGSRRPPTSWASARPP